MKHATATTLDKLEAVLVQLRTIPGLKEKSHGCFYRKSKSFLYFHEASPMMHPAGIFADIDDGADWQRMLVNTEIEKKKLI